MSALPEPILLPHFQFFNNSHDKYLDLRHYPNAYLDTEKGFIRLETIYQCLMQGIPLSFENRGFSGCSELIGDVVLFSSWFHFKPKAENNGISYSWNGGAAADKEQTFLRLNREARLLQAIKGDDGDFVGLLQTDDSRLLITSTGNQTQSIPAPPFLERIMKVERLADGWLIQGIVESFADILISGRQEFIIHHWFCRFGGNGLVHMGSDYRDQYQYPDFLRFQDYSYKYWCYGFKEFPNTHIPVNWTARWIGSYKDMNFIMVKLHEPFSGQVEEIYIAAHNDLSNEYLEKIGKLVADNIPSSMIQSLRNTYGV